MSPTFLLVVGAVVVAPIEHRGRVIAVADGDTLTLLTDHEQQLKIRLSCIDAPEKSQAFGNQAKKALSQLAFRKDVVVLERDRDRYGRVVGDVMVAELNVNKRLVELGMAWVYRKYCRDPSYLELETTAREAPVGLWTGPESQRIEPWKYRKGTRSAGVTDASSLKPNTCGNKRYCTEMVDCAEARFYLTVCGVTSLDRDKDGVPCETLCGQR